MNRSNVGRMGVTWICLSLIVIVVLCIYIFLTRNDDCFKKRGVEFEKPKIFFGNMLNVFIGFETESSLFEYMFEKFSREKLFGLFVLSRPVFVIRDVALAKQIMVEHFDCFINYAGARNYDKLFDKTLTNLEDDEWRNTRRNLNPLFTNANVSRFHRQVLCCANNLPNLIDNDAHPKKQFKVNTEEMFGIYVAESIATTFLGLELDHECDKIMITEAHQIAKFIESDLTSFTSALKMLVSPLTTKFFECKLFRQEVYEFIDKVIDRAKDKTNCDVNENGLSRTAHVGKPSADDVIASQIIALFTCSFKATVQLLQDCCWQLAKNQKVQNELITEIDDIIAKLNGKVIDYETLNSMKYLDCVILETLRKSPPMPFGTRTCNKNYLITTCDGDLLKFERGDVIHIPFKLIQNDPQNFVKPDFFDPKRFLDGSQSEENLLAFGMGQRSCLGRKFVLLQVKVAVFAMLSQFSIHLSDSTYKVTERSNGFVKLQCRVNKMRNNL